TANAAISPATTRRNSIAGSSSHFSGKPIYRFSLRPLYQRWGRSMDLILVATNRRTPRHHRSVLAGLLPSVDRAISSSARRDHRHCSSSSNVEGLLRLVVKIL